MSKLFSRMNLLERIGLFLSILYGTGVVALIQHSSLYLGFEDIDFLRLKPIIVGLQYYIYIGLPFVTLMLPSILAWRCFSRTCFRIAFGASGTLAAIIMLPMMFHYFMPGVYMADFHGITWSWFPIIGNFWMIYLSVDCHWVGHAFIFIFLSMLCFKAHQARRRRIRKASRIVMFALLAIGLVWLMFFFNRDFYMNISQSAGGGAPKAGIITIRDPGVEMSRSNFMYADDAEEISKPCFLLYEGDNYILTSEMFLNHRYLKALNENSIVRSVFRQDKSRVMQFTPISYYQLWHKGNASIITNTISGDVVQRLDLHVVGLLTSTNKAIAAELASNYNTTNTPKMTFWVDNDGCSRTKASCVSMSPSRGSNIVCHIDFHSVPCQRGVQIWQWEQLMTNSNTRVGLRIDNFPISPSGFRWEQISMTFNCNFIYPIGLPWQTELFDGKTLIVHKEIGK